MTPVTTGDASRAGRKPLKDIENHPRMALIADDEFEQDWNHAISGDELVQRVHRHILGNWNADFTGCFYSASRQ
jgi:hypothetical protein